MAERELDRSAIAATLREMAYIAGFQAAKRAAIEAVGNMVCEEPGCVSQCEILAAVEEAWGDGP